MVLFIIIAFLHTKVKKERKKELIIIMIIINAMTIVTDWAKYNNNISPFSTVKVQAPNNLHHVSSINKCNCSPILHNDDLKTTTCTHH